MIKTSILLGSALVAIASTPARAAPEPTTKAAASQNCDEKSCVRKIAATCIINPARRDTVTCQHSARDLEELGRQQLDQLIASIN